MTPDLIIALACAFVFGTLAGSFLNVCAWRLPRNLSVVTPPSRCGACGTVLAWHENLPVIGWLRLGGKCSHCGTGLSPRYLVMELLTGALCAGTVAWAWLSPVAPAPGFPDETTARAVAGAVVLTAVFLALVATVVDIDHQIIPDEISLPMVVLGPLLGAATAYTLHPLASGWIPIQGMGHGSGETFRLDAVHFAQSLLIYGGGALAVVLLTIPVAGRIYRRLPEGERWCAADLRAFRTCTLLAAGGLLLAGVAAVTCAYSDRWYEAVRLHQTILGAAVGWLLPVLVGFIGSTVLRRGAMGFGDAKIFMPLGAFLGPQGTVEAFVIAVFLGAALGIPGWLRGGSGILPFGPSLVLGWAVMLTVGPWIPRPW